MKVTDKDYYLENFLVEELDHLKRCVGKNWDGVIVIDGVEGSAKTTLGGACCYYLDRNFNLNNVVFTHEQFDKAIDNAPVGTAILWDEFGLGGLATEATTKLQNMLLKKMTTIRKKRLYIILVMSWFFELRKYFAVGRTRFLLHTTTPDGLSRGYLKYWGFDAKRKLYFKGRKTYEYGVIKPTLHGKFTNTDGLFYDLHEYDVKKEEAIKTISSDKDKDSKYKKQRDDLIVWGIDVKGFLQKEMAKVVGLSPRTVSTIYTDRLK